MTNKKTRGLGMIVNNRDNSVTIEWEGSDKIVLSSGEAYKLFQLLATALPELKEIRNDFGEVISREWFLNKYNLK